MSKLMFQASGKTGFLSARALPGEGWAAGGKGGSSLGSPHPPVGKQRVGGKAWWLEEAEPSVRPPTPRPAGLGGQPKCRIHGPPGISLELCLPPCLCPLDRCSFILQPFLSLVLSPSFLSDYSFHLSALIPSACTGICDGVCVCLSCLGIVP